MNENYSHINEDVLVKYLLNEASPEERRQVEAWMESSAENRRYFEQFRLIWEKSRSLAEVSLANEELAWQRFRSRLGQPKPKPAYHKGWFRIAALFIILAGAGLTLYLMNRKVSVHILTVHTASFIRKDTLPDGSVITLNRNSGLIYPSKFEGPTRTVRLSGEAFFNVMPDSKKPFIIEVDGISVKVVGTSFNVRSTRGVTEVIVETGIVQVTNKDRRVELRPREKLVVHDADSVMVKDTEPERLYNYYRTGTFQCDHTPLWKLVDVLNEAYNARIIIDRKELRNLPLSTTFSNESLDHILEVVSLTFGIRVVKENDKIYLR